MKNIYGRKIVYTAFAAIFLTAFVCALFLPSAAHASQPMTARVVTAETGDVYLEWSAVSGADSYIVNAFLSDQKISDDIFTTSTFLLLDDIVSRGGEYSFTVTALCDGEALSSAEATHSHTTTLSAPSGFTFSEGRVSWLPTPYAAGYEITVNEIFLGTVTECSFDLSDLIVLSGEYVFTATATGDEYNLPSAVSSFAFFYTAAPLPPYDILLCRKGKSYIASWTPCTEFSPDEYVYRVDFASSTLVFATTEDNFADLTAHISEDGTYTIYVACVKDGVAGSFFSREFIVENGVPLL